MIRVRISRAVVTLAAATGLLAGGALLGASPATAAPATAAPPVSLRLIGINDFHGNLQPPTGSSGRVTLADGTTVDAGGAAFMATHVKQLRAAVPNSIVVGQGDLIGASPLASALFHDEPTIDLMNSLGMAASAAGNHEFDEGYQELLRMQRGGCHPTDGCKFDNPYRGAHFPYLGANVTLKQPNGFPALLPFWISWVQGIPVGYIGMPLKDTPTIVSPAGITQLNFGDEIAAANRYADVLDRLGVKSIVMLVHQGDNATGGPDSCNTTPGPARVIAEGVSPKIDAVLTAHSHQQYSCTVTDPAGNPRPFIQGLSFGRELSVVDLSIDRRTRDVIRAKTSAHNEIVTRTVPADPAAQTIVDKAVQLSAPLANTQVGTITADIVKATNPAGEGPLGDLIADSQLDQTKASAGAQLALMNIGGVRADLTFASSTAGEGDGVVTYGEAFTVQPFSNILQTLTYTGAQLKATLEQQWQAGGVVRILQPSTGLTYSWSASAPQGSRVSNLALNGTPIDPAATYRVTVNNFLSAGGDGFTTLTGGTNVTGGPIDLDAFTAYLTAHPGQAPPALNRITTTP